MQKTTSIFLSYSWENQKEADQIYTDLIQVGIVIKKDSRELKYKDNLKAFMQSIRDADFAILLISPSYLKSVNCMYEAGHLLKERDFKSKILPIIIDGTSIFKPHSKLEYIKYWQSEKEVLQGGLQDVDPLNALEVYSDLKAISDVANSIDGFLQLIKSMLVVKYSELRPTNYRALLNAIGYEDISYLTDLMGIVKYESIEKRELLLDKYITKYPPNSYYYTVKAVTYAKAKKFEQAKFNYEEAIKSKADNYEALNNLGMLYQEVFKDIPKAKDCFEKAIEADPELTVARLNLGVLMSRFLKDEESAKIQYETILRYDPKEPKAHNNLGNYYRDFIKKKAEFGKAEYHFQKAIEYDPKYIEAYMNYANLLKLNGDFENGNELYRKALVHDKTGHYAPVINVLLNSVKG